MLFTETKLHGAWVLDLELRQDTRGSFARTFCRKEFANRGIEFAAVQANIATTRREGTVRGLHYQVAPAAEMKLIRCTRGAVFDVIVDLRPGSPTYLQHLGVELTVENRRQLLAPAGFAHGYQTVAADTEVTYLVSEFYTPECERGVRYDDPALGIRWPLPAIEISAKDLSWPALPCRRPLPDGTPPQFTGNCALPVLPT
jgi:dTDP-4-dehydrorhamnose 3,5-epimerase